MSCPSACRTAQSGWGSFWPSRIFGSQSSLLNLADSKPVTNWVIKATSQEAWAAPPLEPPPVSGLLHRRVSLALPTAEKFCALKALCDNLHLLPRSLLRTSMADFIPRHPSPPLFPTARKEDEIEPHLRPLPRPPPPLPARPQWEHDRRFPTKTEVTPQSFLPA